MVSSLSCILRSGDNVADGALAITLRQASMADDEGFFLDFLLLWRGQKEFL